MEPIDSTRNTSQGTSQRRRTERKPLAQDVPGGSVRGSEGSGGTFAGTYSGKRRNRRREVEELLDEVMGAGERLRHDLSLEAIKAYRESVAEFMRAVVDRSLEVTESVSPGSVLRRKKFYLVEVVDRKLESLGAAVLSGQADQLNVLQRVDEIRGLLVDLMS